MGFQHMILASNERWNRKILRVYWVVLALSTAVELANMYISKTEWHYFLLRYVALPAGSIVACILLTQILVKFSRLPKEYVLLCAGDAIALILIAVHATVPVTTAILILPVVIAAFYFDAKKVIYTAVIAFVSLVAMYLFMPALHDSIDQIDIVTLLAVLVGGSYICTGIMQRGVELLNQLRDSLEANQSLMIRSIMAESVSKLDGLTGTYNHKSFHEHLDELIKQSDERGSTVHLLLFDIDDFKKINDTYGHHSGDAILRRVAEVVKQQVSAHDFVARYGGEEFAVVLVDRENSGAEAVANRICMAINETHHEEIRGSITISGGLVRYEPGRGKDWLFVEADQRLYSAKDNGKNHVQFECSVSSQPIEWQI